MNYTDREKDRVWGKNGEEFESLVSNILITVCVAHLYHVAQNF